MNWLDLLRPILLEIVKRILERKVTDLPPTVHAVDSIIPDDACDRLAAELSEAVRVGSPTESFRAVGGGLVSKVDDLIAALKARDLAAAWKVINDIVGVL